MHTVAASVKMNTVNMAPQMIGFLKDSTGNSNSGVMLIYPPLLDMKRFGTELSNAILLLIMTILQSFALLQK